MRVKTSKLTGRALDWAVAKAEGYGPVYTAPDKHAGPLFLRKVAGVTHLSELCYSTDWTHGGPIIERMFREGLELRQGEPEAGNQRAWARIRDKKYYSHESSPLIAAMRCYVASKLGDEIEVPDDIL